MKKVFIIGLDGATFSLVRPWVEEGKLPQIGQLMAHGVWGNLKSTIPPITACAWASFITGLSPANTGIFDLFYREPGSYKVKPIHRGLRHGKELWQLLNAGGKKVGIINVPTTYPAHA